MQAGSDVWVTVTLKNHSKNDLNESGSINGMTGLAQPCVRRARHLVMWTKVERAKSKAPHPVKGEALKLSVELTFDLVNRTRDRREHVVSIRPDQTNRANHDYENDRQHHCIFRDVLTVLIVPKRSNELFHLIPPVGDTKTERPRDLRRKKREEEERFQTSRV